MFEVLKPSFKYRAVGFGRHTSSKEGVQMVKWRQSHKKENVSLWLLSG